MQAAQPEDRAEFVVILDARSLCRKGVFMPLADLDRVRWGNPEYSDKSALGR
ncbi:hypothetical protein GCM10022403_058820 [Streptomyces coacervatus]|uniref:Uncharacterized protein n=1 Tax=Streptomyces coacervatus TaxID=647381 RepID=A0ABP7IG57_9ACTN